MRIGTPGDAMFPQLARFTDLGLLLLRWMVGIVFFTSGWSHLKDPAGRSQSIGMSKGFTVFLGLAEVAGSLGVIFGVLPQLAGKRTDSAHTGRYPEEDFCLAHWVLGRKNLRLALRPPVCGHVPVNPFHRSRTLCFAQVACDSFPAAVTKKVTNHSYKKWEKGP
jgi:hypothetical protein